MTLAVILIYAVWFLIWVLYIFKPRWLGRLRYPLHITGWANNWSMFVQQKNASLKGSYQIFFKDVNSENKASEWIQMPKVAWQPLASFMGLEVRKETLIRHFTKGVLKAHHSGEAPDIHPFFHSLCELVLAHGPKTVSDFRQVKIEYYPAEDKEPVVIKSKLLPVI